MIQFNRIGSPLQCPPADHGVSPVAERAGREAAAAKEQDRINTEQRVSTVNGMWTGCKNPDKYIFRRSDSYCLLMTKEEQDKWRAGREEAAAECIATPTCLAAYGTESAVRDHFELK